MVRFGAFEAVYRSPANDNKEYNSLIMIEYALLYNVC